MIHTGFKVLPSGSVACGYKISLAAWPPLVDMGTFLLMQTPAARQIKASQQPATECISSTPPRMSEGWRAR